MHAPPDARDPAEPVLLRDATPSELAKQAAFRLLMDGKPATSTGEGPSSTDGPQPDEPPGPRFTVRDHDSNVTSSGPIEPESFRCPPLGSVDFSDLVTRLKAHGLIPPDPIPPDPITPAEAAEELDDIEAEEIAAVEAAEALADREPGARPTWSELFASDEADRRFRLDFLDRVSIITLNHTKPAETPEGEIVWKLPTVPDGIEKKLGRFLAALLDAGTSVAREIGKGVGENG